MDLRRDRRDVLHRAAADNLAGSHSERARELHRLLTQYHDSPRWRRDRVAALCPYEAETIPALLYEILRIDPVVLSAERLRKVVADLGAEPPLFATSDMRDTGKAKRSESNTGATHGIKTGTRAGGRPRGG
jgi:hypothetical protein